MMLGTRLAPSTSSGWRLSSWSMTRWLAVLAGPAVRAVLRPRTPAPSPMPPRASSYSASSAAFRDCSITRESFTTGVPHIADTPRRVPQTFAAGPTQSQAIECARSRRASGRVESAGWSATASRIDVMPGRGSRPEHCRHTPAGRRDRSAVDHRAHPSCSIFRIWFAVAGENKTRAAAALRFGCDARLVVFCVTVGAA